MGAPVDGDANEAVVEDPFSVKQQSHTSQRRVDRRPLEPAVLGILIPARTMAWWSWSACFVRAASPPRMAHAKTNHLTQPQSNLQKGARNKGKPSAKSHFRDFRALGRRQPPSTCQPPRSRPGRSCRRHSPITVYSWPCVPASPTTLRFMELLPANPTRYVPGEKRVPPHGAVGTLSQSGQLRRWRWPAWSPVPGATPKSVFDAEPKRQKKKGQSKPTCN